MNLTATFFSDRQRTATYNLREMRELCAAAGLNVFQNSNWLKGLEKEEFFPKALCILFRKDDPDLKPEMVEDLIPAHQAVEAVRFLASIAAGQDVSVESLVAAGASPLAESPVSGPSAESV